MEYVALITVLMLMQLMFFMGKVGAARVKHDIKAPAMSGHEDFDKANRVHQNTIEQLVIMMPAMWVCALHTSAMLAAGAGLVFIIGRFVYGAKYVADPESRGIGMGIGFLGIIVSVLGALWGIVSGML